MNEIVRTGRCFCGAIRFEARGEPRFVSNCHCESCRRASSAPSVTWAGFKTERVTLTGENLRSYASSPGVQRFFCGACGTQVAFRGERWAGETHLTVCAFDAPDELPPQSDHFADEKLAWSAVLTAVRS
jgi:hypothetical protein